jgi:hypothetical protein
MDSSWGAWPLWTNLTLWTGVDVYSEELLSKPIYKLNKIEVFVGRGDKKKHVRQHQQHRKL